MVSFWFCSKSARCFSRDVVNTVPYKIRRGSACRYPANPPLDNITPIPCLPFVRGGVTRMCDGGGAATGDI